MSLVNEEEFKIERNGKKYLIIISIQEDQLGLVLIYLSHLPKKFSGIFSLNELRISSKIFEHTKTLFEAKEIIKRTVIKKQLLIDEDEFRARITFDTGLGHNSVPFPIILFRDSDDKGPRISQIFEKNEVINNDNDMKDPSDNLKKSFINKIMSPNNNNLNNLQNNNNNINGNANTILRASIGNNINNKMLNNVQSNGQIQFNNSMKVLTSSKIYPNNNINNMNTIKNNFQNNTNFKYKEVDLRNNMNTKNNLENGLNNNNNKLNKNKDFVNYNNNILYNIYNNMNNNNNVNSSFYKDLSKSFAHSNNQNPLSNEINNIPPIRKGMRNIDNNMSESNIASSPIPITNINNNTNINANLTALNVQNPNNQLLNNIINNNINNNIPIQNITPNINNNRTIFQNNNYYTQYNPNIQKPITNQVFVPKPIINPIIIQKQPNNPVIMPKPVINQPIIPKPVINPGIIINNQSFHTAPIQRNVVQIPNIDSRINQNLLFNENTKRKTYNLTNNNNNMKLSISEDSDSENNEKQNLEEYNKDGDQPYRFKNLLIHGSKKVKGNLEKFQKNQNIGDYKPSGTKFVSYLKFPDTKKNVSNKSLTLSTISSSITSGSNRVIGIEKNIIKHPGELEEISSRIQRILNKRNIKYRIIYRSNIDGDSANTFHEKCDKIRNTLILIKASGNKRFGGFTSETWDGNDIDKKDNKCFIFSIDKMKIYDVIEGQNAINCNPDLGPVFLSQIKLLDKFFTQGGTTSKKGKNFNTTEDFEITDGAEKFGVQEVEVYQIK
jgi:hypothetical protein